jgi:hypothetical protein
MERFLSSLTGARHFVAASVRMNARSEDEAPNFKSHDEDRIVMTALRSGLIEEAERPCTRQFGKVCRASPAVSCQLSPKCGRFVLKSVLRSVRHLCPAMLDRAQQHECDRD